MHSSAALPTAKVGQESDALRILLNATSTLLEVPELSHVLPRILELASRILPADGYAVWRHDGPARAWRTIAERGLSREYSFEVPDENAQEMPAFPIIVPDVHASQFVSQRAEVYEHEGIRSLLAIPLLFRGVPQGTICFYYRSPHSFTAEEASYGTALANIASAAIATAELYDAQRAERLRSEFLANAGAVLASSLDYQATLQKVAGLAVPAIADWCTVHTFYQGKLEKVAVAHQDPSKVAVAEELQRRYPENIRPGSSSDRILRTGESEMYASVPDELLVAAAMDDEHLRLIRALGITSAISVAIKARGAVIGILRLIFAESGRRFTQRDLSLAEDLAARAGMAIDNARLYQALQTQQSELRLVLDAVPSLIAFVDNEQRFQFTNLAYAAWFGTNDLRGVTVRELIGDTAYDRVREYIERALLGEYVMYEEELPFARGGTRTVQGVYLPNLSESGAVRGYVAFVTDITAQKAIERNIRLSEERFRGVFANANVPMVIAALDGKIVRANDAYCRLTGYTEEELRTTTSHELTHPEDAVRNMNLYADLLAGKIPSFAIEKRYIRKDGKIVWIRAGASLLRGADGTPTQVIGIAEDITDRKRAQEESSRLMTELESERSQLRAVVEQLRMVEDAVEAGTWVWDVETGVSHWPPGISALWGLPAQHHDVTFEDFVTRIHPDDKDRVVNTIRNSLENTGRYEIEFRVIWPDASEHWLAARGAIVRDSAGRPKQVVGIALEATRRIKTEEALRQSEKLAAAGRLAATIAHEINNPLEAVTNLLFLSHGHPDLPPDVREYLAKADQELGRVTHIARQTLGFYRESVHQQSVNLSEAVEQIVALYSKKITAKNIELDLRLERDAKVHGSQGELRQVVSNIILNAVDAVAMHGRIAIRTRPIPSRGVVRLTVADNGSGISPADRVKLFQPFFTTKRDIGTGLGLWVSRGIVEKHGGKILVRSSVEKDNCGTVFVVDLPVQRGN